MICYSGRYIRQYSKLLVLSIVDCSGRAVTHHDFDCPRTAESAQCDAGELTDLSGR